MCVVDTSLTYYKNLLKSGLRMVSPILRRPDVEAVTGLSRSTIYKWIDEGSFPKPVKLGPRAVGWREADINDWLETRDTAV